MLSFLGTSPLTRAYRTGLVAMVGLMLVPAIVSAGQLWSATRKVAYVSEVGVPGAHVIGRIDGLMNAYRKEQWQYLALRAGDSERAETAAAMVAGQAEMRALFAAYRDLPLREPDEAALARFEADWSAYLDTTGAEVALADAGHDSLAVATFNAGHGEVLWEAMKADLSAWRARDVAVASAYHADVRRWSLLTLVTLAGLLVAGVLVAVRVSRILRRRLAQGLDRLSTAAFHDVLTGVPNRRAWDRALRDAITRASRDGVTLSVAMIDIDHFKTFNDTYGHPAGDALLRDAATAWRARLRPDDLLARYGGEEFTVLTLGPAPAEVRATIDALRPGTPSGQTFSAGIATWDGAESPQSLVRRADEALYRSKRDGRNRVTMAAPTAAVTLPG